MPAGPQVRLPHGGMLRGVADGGVAAFLGVPYARSPTGPLRYRPPRPAPAWAGIRDATRAGLLAPQSPSRLTRVLGPQQDLGQSEDCLTLNVWTPGNDAVRPVLVFVHGGGFLTGGGGLDWYHGGALAARGDLVVVTINYRQGFLGYGYLPEVTGPDPAGAARHGAGVLGTRDLARRRQSCWRTAAIRPGCTGSTGPRPATRSAPRTASSCRSSSRPPRPGRAHRCCPEPGRTS